MTRLTKNRKIALEKIDEGKLYKLSEAAPKVKEITLTKFDASVDIDVRLGVDPRKANQMVRGVVTLPHGTGKASQGTGSVPPIRRKKPKLPAPIM
jgi:large subunit ribosomal protein L1